MQIEEWKPIKNFEKYHISNFGNVKNSISGKILRAMTSTSQLYLKFGLFQDGKTRYAMGHRLVAEHFLENPNNYPVVHHKDSNKHNNNVNNLEWCTYSQNTKYAIESGAFKQRFGKDRNPITMFNEYHIKAIKELKQLGWSITELTKVFGCSRGYISEIINNKKRIS